MDSVYARSAEVLAERPRFTYVGLVSLNPMQTVVGVLRSPGSTGPRVGDLLGTHPDPATRALGLLLHRDQLRIRNLEATVSCNLTELRNLRREVGEGPGVSENSRRRRVAPGPIWTQN